MGGMSLGRYLESRGGRLDYNEALQILLPVLSALSDLHAQGGYHGAVSPDCIWIMEDGTPFLMEESADPPEAFAPRGQPGEKPGPHTDIYSVAACFFAALTGSPPPSAGGQSLSVYGASLPAAAERAILRGLNAWREDSYRSALEFKFALLDYGYTSVRQPKAANSRIQHAPLYPAIQKFPEEEAASGSLFLEACRENKAQIRALAIILLLAVLLFTHVSRGGGPAADAPAPLAFPHDAGARPSVAQTPPAQAPPSPEPPGTARAGPPTAVTDRPFLMVTSLAAIPCRYTGEWAEGKPNGYGTAVVSESRSVRVHADYRVYWSVGDGYSGTWDNGFLTGMAEESNANGDRYTGAFQSNEHSGQGTYTWSNGESYSGGWRHNMFHGSGSFFYADGSLYEGHWENGLKDGRGTLTLPDGSRKEGLWEGDVFLG